MTQSNSRPLTWRPRTFSDALDGSNIAEGAMASLSNLIPDPTMKDVWVCRPGGEDMTAFPGFLDAGFVSGLLVVGDIAYGLIATNADDKPFAYDLVNDVFLPVSGITGANVPVSPPATGDWTPPILCQVGPRIIVCHPGFPGDAYKFGWFDVSGAAVATTGNFSTVVTFTGDTDTADPAGANMIEGQPFVEQGERFVFANNGNAVPVTLFTTVTGAGIPANTVITGVFGVKGGFTGDTANTDPIIRNLKDAVTGAASTVGLYVGQTVTGDGIPFGATVVSINRAGFTATLSLAATKSANQSRIINVGSRISLSKNVTATGDGITFTTSNGTTITGNPTILGVQPGMAVTGAGVSAGATVLSTEALTATISGTAMAGSNEVVTVTQTGNLSVGMAVTGAGVPTGAVVQSLAQNAVILSLPMLGTGGVQLFFTGATISIHGHLTGPASNVALAISGGTHAAPQWGAGDTNINNLPSVPLGVGQMAGRAYFVLGTDGIAFSDSLIPCQITNATQVQALNPGNGLPCTAIGALQLSSLTGGIVQGLIVFQNADQMQQITGDPTTNNLTMNSLPVATGTLAPLSIAPSHLGLFFVSPDGVRLIDFSGRVSPPFGQEGDGAVIPFINALTPSRICAAANGKTLRVTVASVFGSDSPPALVTAEYWYGLTRRVWSGRHTSSASLVQSWGNTFVLAPYARNAVLLRSDDQQSFASVYTENGALLNWTYQTVLLPDNQQVAMNCVIEGNVDTISARGVLVASCFDDDGNLLDSISVRAASSGFRQRPLPWTHPLEFKQAQFQVTGVSDASVRIGNLYLRVEVLGYNNLEALAIPYLTDEEGNILTDNDGNRIIAA